MIEQIRMIQLYLSMGLSTNEIADLFHCTTEDGRLKDACIANGIQKAENKLAEIRDQIAILRKAEAQLHDVIANLQDQQAKGAEQHD